jgi:hypothetical protein
MMYCLLLRKINESGFQREAITTRHGREMVCQIRYLRRMIVRLFEYHSAYDCIAKVTPV